MKLYMEGEDLRECEVITETQEEKVALKTKDFSDEEMDALVTLVSQRTLGTIREVIRKRTSNIIIPG